MALGHSILAPLALGRLPLICRTNSIPVAPPVDRNKQCDYDGRERVQTVNAVVGSASAVDRRSVFC